MLNVEKKIIGFWLLLLIIIGSNQMLKAQDTAHVLLISDSKIDVCGNIYDKEIVVYISIGEVKPSDGFYGFDFEVSYNRSKFIFNEGLYMSTLASFFDEDKRSVEFWESGLIKGYGVTSSSYSIYGDMPLIAFKGRYLGNCPDTSYLRLKSLNFTEEYTKVFDSTEKYLLVKTEILDKPNRSISAGFSTDTIMFNEADSIGIATAKINVTNNLRLENIEFEIVTDSAENFRIDTVTSVNSKLNIDSTFKTGNTLIIYTTVFDELADDSIFAIKIKDLKRNGEIKELKLTPLKVNDCACIKKLAEGKIIAKGNKPKDTTNTGNIEIENKIINGYYSEIKDKIIIESESEIREVIIYNMLGNLIKNIIVSDINKNAEIEANGLPAGIYLVAVRDKKNEIKKIVMIKN
ncbi:MAG: T9SS type A sorting domain-containing protein [Ignavibacteriae bacterium]|nr:T9SS type A sorting domain-containing protein [Ignavibacteriota bacterium]